MIYESNPKHKEPWQRGRKGSLCPSDWEPTKSGMLLAESLPDPTGGGARFATDGQRAFAAHEHETGRWHGHPVGWKEVPEQLRRTWVDEGKLKRRWVRQYWESSEEPA